MGSIIGGYCTKEELCVFRGIEPCFHKLNETKDCLLYLLLFLPSTEKSFLKTVLIPYLGWIIRCQSLKLLLLTEVLPMEQWRWFTESSQKLDLSLRIGRVDLLQETLAGNMQKV